MLNDKGFDLWADGYDESVGLSDEDNSYPFAGYKAVLNKIYGLVLRREKPRVLDVGFGTGTLASKLYERGCEVWGQDFSARMIELARRKMPHAKLYQGDFSKGLAAPILNNDYDFIIATYSLHHLDYAGKVALIQTLRRLLSKDGTLLIGDVAFETAGAQARCREAAGNEWDDDEIYFVYDELKRDFPEMTFEPLSHCAGLLTLGK